MFQKMPQKKKEEVLRKAMDPQQIQKNKDKILAQIDEMVKSGQIDKGQAEAVKSRMGLRQGIWLGKKYFLKDPIIIGFLLFLDKLWITFRCSIQKSLNKGIFIL